MDIPAFTRRDLRIEKFACWVGYDNRRQRERVVAMHRRMKAEWVPTLTALLPPTTDDARLALVEHQMKVMRRWLERALRRVEPRPLVVDDPDVMWSDSVADDFFRNRSRYSAAVRCIPNPPAYLANRHLRVERNVSVLSVMEPPAGPMVATMVANPD